jgi:hypothetical protein
MHQQNSRVEHFIGTIMDKSQAIWLESCALQSWWEFAVDCAIHVYNRIPIQHHNWKTLMSMPDALPMEIALIALLLFKFQAYSTSLYHYYHRPITLSMFRLLH